MKQLNKILYVEDEPDIQAVAQIALESVGGFQVKICSDGKEAILAIPDFQPDLVLLDVMMPGMDGVTTLNEMKQKGLVSDVPVVFMTAKVQLREIEQYKEKGAVDIIAKPFDPMTLSKTIKDIWERFQKGT